MINSIRKIKFIALSIIVAVAFAPLTSCKKYDEGPTFSLSSKTARVTNTWKAEKVMVNGKDETADYPEFRITFSKGGEYSLIKGKGIFDISTNGNWSFINDNDEIQTISDPIFGLSKLNTYRIIRLTQNEMWVIKGDTEFHLISA